MPYAVEVVRDQQAPNGAGVLTLYQDSLVIGSWDCITGGSQKDPHAYGGLTPPIHWEMIEEIQTRTLTQANKTLEMARLSPAYAEEAAEYPKRTFSRMENDPFMIHVAGRSTGCIAVLSGVWRDCVAHLNRAWRANGGSLMIHVLEKADAMAMDTQPDYGC